MGHPEVYVISLPAMAVAAEVAAGFTRKAVFGYLYLAEHPTDEIMHGGMFVVAHFHFVIAGSMVFGFFADLYYWFPKMVGRRIDPMLGRLHFWRFEIGFFGTFTALFYVGLLGE